MSARTVHTLPELAERDHDLVVIGGGIHGCLAALEGARRGLRVALVEADDFGAATSWASHRILHGGLRYLQSLDLARARQSIAERRWFLRTFPDLCEPLRCALPLYGDGLRKPLPFRAALAANAVLSARRNAAVRADRHLPMGTVVPGHRAAEVHPHAAREGLLGVGVWHDGLVTSPARLTMEILRWASSLDAKVANGARAVALRTARAGVVGIEVEDTATGDRHTLRTAAVINAAGPWSAEVAESLNPASRTPTRPSLAFNLLLDRPAPDGACGVSAHGPDAHTYFLAPRCGMMMAGTTHLALDAFRDRPTEAEVRAMVDGLNAAAPGLHLTDTDVLRIDAGVLRASPDDPAEPSDRAAVTTHAHHGGPAGLITLSGVKYTTARAEAARALAAAVGQRPITPAGRTRPAPAPWAAGLALAHPAWARDADLSAHADALHALITAEGVRTLADLVYRRSEWGQDPRTLAGVGARIADALGWDAARADREVTDLGQALASRGPMTAGEARSRADEEPARP